VSVFSNVGGVRPRRSVFNLSYSKKFTADMGIWTGYNFYDLSGMPDAKIVATQFHINSNMAVVFYALFSLLSFSKLV